MADPKTCPDCGRPTLKAARTAVFLQCCWDQGDVRCLRAQLTQRTAERDAALARVTFLETAGNVRVNALRMEDRAVLEAWARCHGGEYPVTSGLILDALRGLDAALARVAEVERERDEARAQLAAVQEREGRMREALEAWGRWQSQEGRALASDRWQDHQEARENREEFMRLYEAALTPPAGKGEPPIDDPQPVGDCPRCGAPVYTAEGFCGGCAPGAR